MPAQQLGGGTDKVGVDSRHTGTAAVEAAGTVRDLLAIMVSDVHNLPEGETTYRRDVGSSWRAILWLWWEEVWSARYVDTGRH